jgi:hypothetical protein
MSDEKQDLTERIEKAREGQPATEGSERTAGGIDVSTPKRKDFFGNLAKVSKDDDK